MRSVLWLDDIRSNPYCYEWSKTCPQYLVHVNPLGKVSRCYDGIEKAFGDVNNQYLDKEKYDLILNEHKNYKALPECDSCKYFKYCQSGCPYMYTDDTGCSVPYRIYDYLELNAKLKEDIK